MIEHRRHQLCGKWREQHTFGMPQHLHVNEQWSMPKIRPLQLEATRELLRYFSNLLERTPLRERDLVRDVQCLDGRLLVAKEMIHLLAFHYPLPPLSRLEIWNLNMSYIITFLRRVAWRSYEGGVVNFGGFRGPFQLEKSNKPRHHLPQRVWHSLTVQVFISKGLQVSDSDAQVPTQATASYPSSGCM